jgi:hypothetical protein
MKKKQVAKPTAKRGLSVGATVAAGLPLLISMITTFAPPKGKAGESGKPLTVASGVFKPGCVLPFDKIKTEGLVVDAECTPNGNATDTAKLLENHAKNNFCATGTPVSIKYEDFTNLQTVADNVEGLRAKLKSSRDDLIGILSSAGKPKLGEGTLVRFATFLLEAHFSNVGSGENVNCKLKPKESNDIHILLTKDPADKEPCNSVTAEMSPHFRPEAWNELVHRNFENPVRLTGPLFFDDSHQPCRDGKGSPKRISIWEIHPIYQFDVCKNKTLAACDVNTDSVWTPLDKLDDGDEGEN